MYGYDIETKAQSAQCYRPEEPRPKKAHQVRSNVKVLLTDFFDYNGLVHHDFLPRGGTVNKEYYLEAMRRLGKAICEKCAELWKNQTWILHNDNAPSHKSMLRREFLPKNKTVIMPQPSTVFSGPRLFPLPKTEDTDKRKALYYNWGDKRKIEAAAVDCNKKRVSEVFRGLVKTLA